MAPVGFRCHEGTRTTANITILLNNQNTTTKKIRSAARLTGFFTEDMAT